MLRSNILLGYDDGYVHLEYADFVETAGGCMELSGWQGGDRPGLNVWF